jgi:hypothetical protein
VVLERYALGLSTHRDTFCKLLEFETPELGSIRGGSARKLLIYKHKDKPGWYFDPTYPDVESAWRAVREAFVQAFSLAEAADWAAIDALAPLRSGAALRVKAVFCYAPRDCCRSTRATTWRTFVSCSAIRRLASTPGRTTMPCTSWSTSGRSSAAGRSTKSCGSSTAGLTRARPDES